MRLDQKQIQQLHEVLLEYFKDNQYELYLYGSRIHDHLRGGDIDLVFIADQASVQLFKEKCLEILVKIKSKKSVGQRKIDLKALTPDQLESDPFFKTIQSELKLLTSN